jgi:hypothetical protein
VVELKWILARLTIGDEALALRVDNCLCKTRPRLTKPDRAESGVGIHSSVGASPKTSPSASLGLTNCTI